MKFKTIMYYSLVITFLGILTSIGLYIYNSYHPRFDWVRFLKYTGWTWFGLFCLGLLIYGLLAWANKEDEEKLEQPIEIVGTQKALEIWKVEFARFNNIPLIYKHWIGGEAELVNPNSIIIRNELRFSDPKGVTSDKFFGFEATIMDGDRVGTMFATIRIDMGQEWIKENWNSRIKDKTTLNTMPKDFDIYPLSNSADHQERMQMKYIDYMDEFGESKANKIMYPFTNQQNQKPQPAQATIVAPTISDQYPEYAPSTESEDKSSDIQDDIKKYREENKV